MAPPRGPVVERVPFAPLELYLRRRGVREWSRKRIGKWNRSAEADQMQAALGVSGAQIQKYRQRGLSMWQADELAVKAGCLPGEIWPEYHEWVPDDPWNDIEVRRAAYRKAKAPRAAAREAKRRANADKNRKVQAA